MQEHGRNTYPLKKVLNTHLTSKQPKNEQLMNKTEAALIKKHQNDIPTNKNLGFTQV